MSDALFPKLAGNQDTPEDNRGLLINYQALQAAQEQLAALYQHNQPFAHVVIDDFLPQTTIAKLLAEYPYDQSLPIWNDATHRDKDSGEYVQKDKRNIRDHMRMPPTYRQLIWELNSHDFLQFLSKLTGIKNLIPDANLRGAGIHQISQGGFLKVHADFTTHREFGLDRRLNFLIYLNQDWPEEYGGHLQLWDEDMQGEPTQVLPVLNRCVIFSTTATSFHGHPKPLTCPKDTHRKSLALYYYTTGRPEGEAEPVFSTLWRDVPERFQ